MPGSHHPSEASTSTGTVPPTAVDKSESSDEAKCQSLEITGKQETTSDEVKEYPTGLKLILIILSLCLATFLVALDGTIIATAIPTITSDFNSLDDVSWYNAAFLLTTSTFQIPYGRAYSLLSVKWVFLAAILIFEVGSVICGAAPTSTALIIGRAVAGIGGAGIFSGAFIIIASTVPLRKRSIYAGALGACFAITSVIAPLIGGAFASEVTWRWCFYINLPIGAIVFPAIAFILPRSLGSQAQKTENKGWRQAVARFDPIGTILLLVWVICLQLALQWAGLQYSWGSPRVIATLVVFGVLFIIWIGIEWFGEDNATVPRGVIAQRSVASATIYTMCGAASFTIVTYYLPLWFQAIKQDSPVESGIHNIPLILSLVVSALSAGGIVYVIGYYVPFLILGSVLASIGAGLLMILKPNSGTGNWIGYQILYGAGIGMSLEQCNVAIQAVLPDDKIAAGTTLGIFARSLAGSLAVSIAQSVFEKRLKQNLATVLPGFDASIISGSGATNLIAKIQEATGGNQDTISRVLDAYNNALSQVFLVALVLAALSLVPSLTVEWKNVKKENKNGKDAEEKVDGTPEKEATV